MNHICNPTNRKEEIEYAKKKYCLACENEGECELVSGSEVCDKINCNHAILQ